MTEVMLGILVLLHALAHAGTGMWAAGPAWIVQPVWFLAMVGWLVVAFAVLEVRGFAPVTRIALVVASVASILLARLAGTSLVSVLAACVNLVVTALAWRHLTERRRRATAALFDGAPVAPAAAPRRWAPLVGAALAWGMLAWTGLVIVVRPATMRWGTTPAERAAVLPGDELQAPGGRYRIDHAVTVNAPAAEVFPWLAQLGQDRAGFYSYDWLERAFGDDVHNADSLVPAWQERKVGDLVRAAQPGYLGGIFGRDLGWRITRFDPPVVMVLEAWGSFVVVPVDGSHSRLVARTLGAGTPSLAAVPFTPFGMLVFEPAHFIMQRAMLLGIKARAERHRSPSRVPATGA